jgi:tetratricopeptide (TPR) repeat protein
MKLVLIVSLLIPILSKSQPNCNAFLYYGDSLRYKACKVAEKREGYYQFSKEYQAALDEAIAIDPGFAYAYEAKSTAYLKSGDFVSWIQLMDKAVALNPKEHLSYRGWCRYQFFKDYEGAIRDIERLDSLSKYDIGHSVNAHYHLHVARALCYKALGQKEKAIDIIEKQLAQSDYDPGLFDYIHLGVLYLEIENYAKAETSLLKQQEINDLAENRYYLGLLYKITNQKAKAQKELEKAKVKYQKESWLFDPYTEPMDKIYMEDIDKALSLVDKMDE